MGWRCRLPRPRASLRAPSPPLLGADWHDGPVPLWIAGAGGVGREALDVAIACDTEVAGLVDDRTAGVEVRGLPVVAPADVPGGATFLVAIGDPGARVDVALRLMELGHEPVTLIHPRAIVGPLTEVGPGCLVSAGTFLSSSVTLESHVQVHYNATVGHDCVLEEGATVLPGANVAGAVRLGRAVTVGSGAVILQSLTIGEGATIGAGAVVTRDVEAGQVMVGNPARPMARSITRASETSRPLPSGPRQTQRARHGGSGSEDASYRPANEERRRHAPAGARRRPNAPRSSPAPR